MRSGVLGPVLSALLVPDPSRRPSAEQLDAMLAQVEAGRSVTGFQAPVPGPRMPSGYYDEWQQTVRYGGGTGRNPVTGQVRVTDTDTDTDRNTTTNTDQLPGYAGRPPVNPYGDTANPYAAGTGLQAAERHRSKASRLTAVSAMSAVCVLALAGFSVWAATTPTSSHANQASGNDAANNAPTFSGPSAAGVQITGGSASSAPPSQNSTSDGSSTATRHLLTPAGVRSVIKQILAVSGGSRVVSMTVYDDHASFDVVKKDDPTVYDTYSFSNGQASFSMTGSTLDQGEPALDPDQVNWDALPALLKDADSTLKVKNPTYHYVIVDSDIIDHTLGLRVYVGDDYRSGYLSADLKGKILERYPQE